MILQICLFSIGAILICPLAVQRVFDDDDYKLYSLHQQLFGANCTIVLCCLSNPVHMYIRLVQQITLREANQNSLYCTGWLYVRLLIIIELGAIRTNCNWLSICSRIQQQSFRLSQIWARLGSRALQESKLFGLWTAWWDHYRQISRSDKVLRCFSICSSLYPVLQDKCTDYSVVMCGKVTE